MIPEPTPAVAERLCGQGIDVVELYSMGERDVLDGLDVDDAHGLVLLCQLYEATLVTLYAAARSNVSVDDVRRAARSTASAWRARRG